MHKIAPKVFVCAAGCLAIAALFGSLTLAQPLLTKSGLNATPFRRSRRLLDQAGCC